MSDVLEQLVELLRLESIGVNRFRGHSQDLGFRNLFGGQVLGQSLSAAIQTLKDPAWNPHSLHAYFLRPGSVTEPIEFEVDVLRDGRSFATRQVKASQKGKAILTMMASFQHPEEGFVHQSDMPEVKGPEGIPSQLELTRMFKSQIPERIREIHTADKPIEIRVVNPANPFAPKKMEPYKYVWMKADAELTGDFSEHARVLAYASDFNLLTTALQPHGVSVVQKDMQVASLDHSIWFHRPFRMDEWLLYAIDSPNAGGARGFCRGQIFNQQGELVASVAQEGLMRQRNLSEQG
ncbi:acyl-CoA thioesterase II [Bacterioplanoides sp. SCSIO 12839]|uniref:acyl-CoA thioesterase II n=1 Tax=Bacterioplanoides sp. SCSIO 12839 TaxID=2829569 RepID=UPI002102722F|nr:acyl-CoA thioesterase II [Bacterioplanoides sp. SCSIO 12839]UTW47074.1 acyl-CoA thioesterase II [Bacterioplanoides sp. SCSIO 12839]